MVTKINPAQICKMVVIGATQDRDFEYVPPKKGWLYDCPGGFTTRYSLTGEIMTAEEVVEMGEGSLVVEGEMVLIRPRVILHLSNQGTIIKYFDSYTEALEYSENNAQLSKIDWLPH